MNKELPELDVLNDWTGDIGEAMRIIVPHVRALTERMERVEQRSREMESWYQTYGGPGDPAITPFNLVQRLDVMDKTVRVHDEMIARLEKQVGHLPVETTLCPGEDLREGGPPPIPASNVAWLKVEVKNDSDEQGMALVRYRRMTPESSFVVYKADLAPEPPTKIVGVTSSEYGRALQRAEAAEARLKQAVGDIAQIERQYGMGFHLQEAVEKWLAKYSQGEKGVKS